MKTNLKDNIFIEGFDDIALWNSKLCYMGQFSEKYCIIYNGKTKDISEEVAKECVIKFWWNGYKDYTDRFLYGVSPKESIQSACSSEYCIIYKEI